MDILGIIVVYFMGNLIPMVEPFETRKACEQALVEALANAEAASKGQAKVLIAECRKVG